MKMGRLRADKDGLEKKALVGKREQKRGKGGADSGVKMGRLRAGKDGLEKKALSGKRD